MRAISDVEEAEPTELPPLFDAVDPEALNHLYQDCDDITVTFTYIGYTVTVTNTGTVMIEAAT